MADTPVVRAMHARFDGWCAMIGCHAAIPQGHVIYRVNESATLCHSCGRAYVDTLPRTPRKERPT